jgi:hypothetical protein
MPRSRSRVCLQDGLKLDLNSLARKGFVQRGCYSGVRGIRWTHSYWGEVASALISADLSDASSGWLKLEGDLNQFISLAAQPSLLHCRSSRRRNTQQPDQPGRGYVHLAHQLPLWWLRLWRAGGCALLITVSRKLGPRHRPGPFAFSPNETSVIWHRVDCRNQR